MTDHASDPLEIDRLEWMIRRQRRLSMLEPVVRPQPPGSDATLVWPGDDVRTISAARILDERPDVLRAFHETFHGPGNDQNSTAWTLRVGGKTPEDYAAYWYREHGRYEGYAQSATTAGDNISLGRILADRPDVLQAYQTAYQGRDRNSEAWSQRVGGETAEDYARYWYDHYGKWEGYAQTEKAAAENINVERLLVERPDVFRAFFEEFYGPNNDRKSTAWVDRVGGDTVQDYAKYWYVAHGRAEGYVQTQPTLAAPAPAPEPAPQPGSEPPPPMVDPTLEPWNHPAIFPDARRPDEAAAMSVEGQDDPILAVGASLDGPALFA